MDIAYSGKCRYEIQEQKEVPQWYTGPFRALGLQNTSTGRSRPVGYNPWIKTYKIM
jgi:hypothetical protein